MTTFCPIMTGIHGPSSNPLLRTSGKYLAPRWPLPSPTPELLHQGRETQVDCTRDHITFLVTGTWDPIPPKRFCVPQQEGALPDWNAVVAWLPALPPSDRHKSTSTSLVQRRRLVSLILKPEHRMGGTTYGTHHLIKISVLVVTRAKPGFWCCDAWNPKKYSHVFFLLIISPSTVFDHCSLAARSRQNNNPPVLPQI